MVYLRRRAFLCLSRTTFGGRRWRLLLRSVWMTFGGRSCRGDGPDQIVGDFWRFRGYRFSQLQMQWQSSLQMQWQSSQQITNERNDLGTRSRMEFMNPFTGNMNGVSSPDLFATGLPDFSQALMSQQSIQPTFSVYPGDLQRPTYASPGEQQLFSLDFGTLIFQVSFLKEGPPSIWRLLARACILILRKP